MKSNSFALEFFQTISSHNLPPTTLPSSRCTIITTRGHMTTPIRCPPRHQPTTAIRLPPLFDGTKISLMDLKCVLALGGFGFIILFILLIQI
ncbi:hypothetical protein ES288_D05G288300v1 [Gossypium darwinii]|uniref:Transmembrane protein n=2 Tax=Gossypium TaxID=3633 RepID=A0A5D2L1G5_GOSTO|nr:hypothetical protein ES288_D05G288300v1 [Gossypium darwinii]TYH72899.1 hypothetical protein ES332_D05G288700v1 [Gossypium tomentosum]